MWSSPHSPPLNARLKLYEVLDKLQDRVLYYDTDSVIFVSNPTSPNHLWQLSR